MRSAARADLVIFDCDGVLVDSEGITNRVLQAHLVRHGARLSVAECEARFAGTSRGEVEAWMAQAGMALPEGWVQEFYADMLEVLEREVAPIPGVEAALEVLVERGIGLCVASNGTMAKMRISLGRTGLERFFEGRIYSAYEVGRSKPAPDVFLHAAAVNGVDVARAVVVEDSANGVRAAKAAGMRCLAYVPCGGDASGVTGEARVFRDMGALPDLVGG